MVGWRSLDPGVTAVTTMLFNPATKEIVGLDTMFNTYYRWRMLMDRFPLSYLRMVFGFPLHIDKLSFTLYLI